MGWCSATDIMDAAVKAADELLVKAYDALGVDSERVTLEDIRDELDDAMRPYVRSIADKLRDGDWDCIEESDYFDRFPQEMLGYSDSEYESRLRQQLKDAVDYGEGDDINKWAGLLAAHNLKVKADKN